MTTTQTQRTQSATLEIVWSDGYVNDIAATKTLTVPFEHDTYTSIPHEIMKSLVAMTQEVMEDLHPGKNCGYDDDRTIGEWSWCIDDWANLNWENLLEYIIVAESNVIGSDGEPVHISPEISKRNLLTWQLSVGTKFSDNTC